MPDYAQINPGVFHLGYRFTTPVIVEPLPLHTNDKYRIELKYKHAVVVNRTLYVGNVQVFDRSQATIRVEGDSMYKSVVNNFDVFASYNKIEAAVNDGDDITALAEFADKILQFKNNTLYIINVSGKVEVLEGTHRHKGVNNPAAVCKTDYGIAWANEHGCYLYDGKQIKDLLEKNALQKIKESEWQSFIVTPMIGYFPRKRQLIVVDDVTDGGDGTCYIYDMVTTSWTKSKTAKFANAIKSNLINDWNGDLVHATSAIPKQWSDTSTTTANYSFTTKDIDFGQPAVRKKIYKVYLSFKGVGTHVQVHYGVDGLVPASTFYPITSGTDGSTTGTGAAAKCIAYDAGTTDWLKAELKPGASINNISSFRLKLSGDGSNAVAADFEINDISIVYRLKNIK